MDNSQDLAYICINTRWLFRKSVWLASTTTVPNIETVVGSGGCQYPSGKDGSVQTDRARAFGVLKYSNWNIVQDAHSTVTTALHALSFTAVPNPVCVVMLDIDMSEKPAVGAWSDASIQQLIRNGTMYGTVGIHTHIIVQIFFKGIPYGYSRGRSTSTHETVSTVIVDSAGVEYCYNLPEDDCEQVALRCVSTILQLATGVKPSSMYKVVPFQRRTYYEDCLYAIFITASCATASSLCAIKHADDPDSGLFKCRPSSRCARPTRIIPNLRFLMFLCKPTSHSIVEGLLLDEVNTLDAFRNTVIDM